MSFFSPFINNRCVNSINLLISNAIFFFALFELEKKSIIKYFITYTRILIRIIIDSVLMNSTAKNTSISVHLKSTKCSEFNCYVSKVIIPCFEIWHVITWLWLRLNQFQKRFLCRFVCTSAYFFVKTSLFFASYFFFIVTNACQ